MPRSVEFLCRFAFITLIGVNAGCGTVPLVTMHDVWDPNAYKPVVQDFGATKLERNMQEIDAQYAETRTPAKVELSLETAELSMSGNNDFAALWRGSRACAWLARNHSDLAERELYAAKGIAMGRKAVQFQSTHVEPYYYTALNLGAYAEIKHEQGFVPSKRLLENAKYMAEMAVAIDPAYDFAGPHRFLGKLIAEASGTLTHSIGSWEEGLDHLRKAVEIAPDFGQNHLFLAEAYNEDGDYELARAELERLYRSPSPPDYTVEARSWLDDAALLLGTPPGGGAEVDVSGFEETATTDSELVPVSGYDESASVEPVGTSPAGRSTPALREVGR